MTTPIPSYHLRVDRLDPSVFHVLRGKGLVPVYPPHGLADVNRSKISRRLAIAANLAKDDRARRACLDDREGKHFGSTPSVKEAGEGKGVVTACTQLAAATRNVR